MNWVKSNYSSNPMFQYNHRVGVKEPVGMYNERYAKDADIHIIQNAARYYNECLIDLNGSLLLFGSGHSYFANCFYKALNFNKIYICDLADNATIGLYKNIIPFIGDFKSIYENIPKVDYIFSSHTLEHFDRDTLFLDILPKLFDLANKSCIFVVPYGDNWSDDIYHKLKFTLDDEFIGSSDFYKLIKNDKELVVRFDL